MNEEKQLKKERIEVLKKNLFVFALTNLFFISSMKLIGMGLPYYKDSQKKYSISTTHINNFNDITIKEKYLTNKDLISYKKENKIYIKDDYKYQDNTYTRNVKVYKLSEEENYEEVLNDYQNYINKKNLIDEYQESTPHIDKYDSEIAIEYYTIDKDKYIRVYESKLKNNISSILYSLVLALTTTSVTYTSIDSINSINNNLKKIKKLKKEP